MNIGLEKEIEKKYLEAVNCYESEINYDFAPNIDSFINLAFLYWEFATEQFAFNNPNSIPDEWSTVGGERFLKIVEMGLKKFPNSLELHFWKRYFQYRLFQDEFTEVDCELLIKKYKDDESLIPYFFLYLFNKEKHKQNRDKLIEICNIVPTAKNLYVKTILQG